MRPLLLHEGCLETAVDYLQAGFETDLEAIADTTDTSQDDGGASHA